MRGAFVWVADGMAVQKLVLAVVISVLAGECRRVPFTLEETFRARSKPFEARWLTDSVVEYRNRTTGNVMSFNVTDGRVEVLVESSILSKFNADRYRFSSDGRFILMGYVNASDINATHPWLRPARYVVYSLSDRAYIHLDRKSYLQHAEWVPGHSAIVYVKDNDVYRVELNKKLMTYAITDNGVPGVIFNGVCDLIYKDEILRRESTLSFSPDGTQLLYLTIDSRAVPEMTFSYFAKPGSLKYQYPKAMKFRYPKPGTPIPKYIVWHFNFTGRNINPVAAYTERREIVHGWRWVANNIIELVYTNRVQNESVTELCYLNSKLEVYPCRKVNEDKNEKGWASTDALLFNEGGDRYLIRSRLKTVGGEHYQLQVVHNSGARIRLTNGDYTVTDVVGWDVRRRIVYYESSRREQPSTDHVYSVYESGRGKPVCLTCRLKSSDGTPCKSAAVTFNRNFTYFIARCRGPAPAVVSVFKNGRVAKDPVQVLDESTGERDWLKQRLEPKIMNFKAALNETATADVRLMLPPFIDTSGKKKYPLIIYVCCGPGERHIDDVFRVDWSRYLSTNLSVIYAVVDGYGSNNKGTEMMYATYRSLGRLEVEEKIIAVSRMQSSLGFIDRERTGIWGWRYGGYVAAKVLEEDADTIFKCGVSAAPITDWIYYNAVYAERYLGLPADNKNAYVNASLLNNVENLKGKRFLLLHGAGDSNVYYQNAMPFARVLERSGVAFEHEVYPDEVDAVDQLSLHVYRSMDQFWKRCFGL